MVETRTKVSGLAHLPGVLLNLVFRDSGRVIGEVAKEMPKVLLFAPFDQKAGNVHIHMHSEMPIRDARIDIAREFEAEERRLDRGEGHGAVAGYISQCDRWRAAEVMAEDMELISSFDIEKGHHVVRDCLRLISIVRLVAVGIAT